MIGDLGDAGIQDDGYRNSLPGRLFDIDIVIANARPADDLASFHFPNHPRGIGLNPSYQDRIGIGGRLDQIILGKYRSFD